MKTKFYILTFLLTFSFGWLYASDGPAPARTITASSLTPSVPTEATFEENLSEDPSLVRWLLKVLAPATPIEADFDEAIPAENNIDMIFILPTVPLEADFNDSL